MISIHFCLVRMSMAREHHSAAMKELLSSPSVRPTYPTIKVSYQIAPWFNWCNGLAKMCEGP